MSCEYMRKDKHVELHSELQTQLQTQSQTQKYLRSSSLYELNYMYEQDTTILQTSLMTKFYGWVRRVRIGDGGRIVFVDVYDGTKVGSLMCLAIRETYLGEMFQDYDYCKCDE